MPADVIGTSIIQEDEHGPTAVQVHGPGPIFSQIVLADEINRATPKNAERNARSDAGKKQVTAGGEVRKLEEPFFVMATQNPLEQGREPIRSPEAQLEPLLLQARRQVQHAGPSLAKILEMTTTRP